MAGIVAISLAFGREELESSDTRRMSLAFGLFLGLKCLVESLKRLALYRDIAVPLLYRKPFFKRQMLNPDLAYVEAKEGNFGQGFPDNPANTEPND